MKVIVILKDGRRFDNVEADDDVVTRGRCEFASQPVRSSDPALLSKSPNYSTLVHYCFSLRTEGGVPVFEER